MFIFRRRHVRVGKHQVEESLKFVVIGIAPKLHENICELKCFSRMLPVITVLFISFISITCN